MNEHEEAHITIYFQVSNAKFIDLWSAINWSNVKKTKHTCGSPIAPSQPPPQPPYSCANRTKWMEIFAIVVVFVRRRRCCCRLAGVKFIALTDSKILLLLFFFCHMKRMNIPCSNTIYLCSKHLQHFLQLIRGFVSLHAFICNNFALHCHRSTVATPTASSPIICQLSMLAWAHIYISPLFTILQTYRFSLLLIQWKVQHTDFTWCCPIHFATYRIGIDTSAKSEIYIVYFVHI